MGVDQVATSLFDLPKTVTELLTRDTLEDLDLFNFIESLYEDETRFMRGSGADFDPKPYIRTFEAALDKLEEMKRSYERQERDLSRDVVVAEQRHSTNVSQLQANLDVRNKN